jgi:hypothetical protein
MNFYVRTLSCLALLGMSLAALSQYRPSWAARVSLDWWSLSELREEIRRGQERDAELVRVGAGALERAAAKEEATQALLAGRLTLTQAASRFRAVNASSCSTELRLSERFRGATEEERLCRQVISWAEAASDGPASRGRGRPIRQRFEAELNALLEKGHGVVALPE